MTIQLPSPLTLITPGWRHADTLDLYVKRDDLIHPVISGNKWRKLAPVLAGLPDSCTGMVSFGGGFSNHLHALGYACYCRGLAFTAIVRGDYRSQPTPMLQDLMTWGATIRYVTKTEYGLRESAAYLNELQHAFPSHIIIPEGGSQSAALNGIATMIEEILTPFTSLLVPVASGATLAGVASALGDTQQAIGIGVLKGEGYLESLVERLLPVPRSNWHVNHDFHFGGYAKRPAALREFCEAFSSECDIPVEPVYSGKLFYALKSLVENRYFAPGSTIVAVHTGGLQGSRKTVI